MKKLMTVSLTILMILSLLGCQKIKKEETEPEEQVTEQVTESAAAQIEVTVDRGSGVTKEFNVKTESNKLTDVLGILKDGGVLNFEISGSEIKSMDGLDSKDNSKWVLYLNDKVCEGDLDSLKVSQGDRILFVYETKESEPVIDILGGWIVNEDYSEKLTKEEKQIFEDASVGISGVGYTPVRVIATQAAVGINYAYLAQGLTVTENPVLDYYIMVIYKDLDGSCEIKAINKINIPDMMTMENSDQVFLKSWMVIRADEDAKFGNKTVQDSFRKAIEGWTGLDVYPLELLATQLVSGTNYLALCYGETVTLDPIGDLYIVEWYEDLNGKTSITRIENLNLQYYVAGE